MKYSEFEASDAYTESPSGSAVRVVIYKASDPSTQLIGRTSGINWNDDFEQNDVDEAGADRIEEISTGKHTGKATVQGFFSAEKNDALPYVDDFLGDGTGEEYVVMEVQGSNRIGEGLPLNVFTGAKISQYGSAHGGRGLKTFSLAFSYLERKPGKAWATETGNA